MNKILIRQIPKDAELMAVGNFFRSTRSESSWRVGAFWSLSDGSIQDISCIAEASCLLGMRRKFVQDNGRLYNVGGFNCSVQLPELNQWSEMQLGKCPRLQYQLTRDEEVARQLCFVFEVDGCKYWLPKFELARKLFFQSGEFVRAALEPNGLDRRFRVFYGEDGAIHIDTLPKIGVSASTLKIKGFRDFLGWVLLDEDVRSSFASIRGLLNQHSLQSNGYLRWRFDFVPPWQLAGCRILARGAMDQVRGEMLIWEISEVKGLRFGTSDEVVFHHPALRQPVRGQGGSGFVSLPEDCGDEEIDFDQEPDEARDRQYIELPAKGLVFADPPRTRIAYAGQKRGSRAAHEESLDASEHPHVYGLGEDVQDGTCTPGDFRQGFGEDGGPDAYPSRFSLLKTILERISVEKGIRLVRMEERALPSLPRRKVHLMEDGSPRCVLIAEFSKDGGPSRYLLEIDLSDNKRNLASQVVGFESRFQADDMINNILRGVIKDSLKWPVKLLQECCSVVIKVCHPPFEGKGDRDELIANWVSRLGDALSGVD